MNIKESLISTPADIFITNHLFVVAIGLKLFLCIYGKFLISKKLNSDIIHLFWNNIFFVRLWLKVFVSQGWVRQKLQYTLYFSIKVACRVRVTYLKE